MKKGEARKEKNIPIASSWPQIFRKDHANMYNITIDNSKWRKKKDRRLILLYLEAKDTQNRNFNS